MTDEKYQLVVIRHKRPTEPQDGSVDLVARTFGSVELVNKHKFDFTDEYVYLRKNENTGYEEYCHKDDYDLYQK